MTKVRISHAVEGYVIARTADGFSPHSIDTNKRALQRLVDYLGDPPLEEVDLTMLRSFMAYMRTEYKPMRFSGDDKPLAEASLERVWSAIRSFYTWAEAELGTRRPDLNLRKPQYKPTVIKPFTQEELEALMNAAKYTVEARTKGRVPFRMCRPTANRDLALILVLLDTGVRVSECARIKLEDISLPTGEIVIHPYLSGRKSQPRTVFLGKSARRAVWRYVNEREQQDEYLFVTIHGRPMNRNTIRVLLSRLGKRAGVDGVHPHRFRHTFAIQYLRNGGDVFTLQRLLGHSSLDIVKKYLNIVKDDSQNAHRSASPVDRWRL